MDDAPARPLADDGEDPAERLALMRRVAVLMFLVGGLACGLGVVLKDLTLVARVGQSGFAACFAICGVTLLVLRPRKAVIEGSTVLSITFLSGLMGTSDQTGMTPFFYLWPVVFAAYFASPRLLRVSLAWMTVTLGAALALNHHILLKVDTFTGTVASVGLMAPLVAAMQGREARLRERLAVAAHTDPLTGLLNRRAFSPQLAALFERAACAHEDLSVVLFDLDHFKQFNDVHGHLAGDAALRRFADVLHRHARPDDLISRFGGEEFAAVLPGAGLVGAREYAEHVADELLHASSLTPHLALTTSAGISSLRSGHATVGALLAGADGALYAAKAAGRARAAWWDGRSVQVGVGPRERVAPEVRRAA
jgi:diguanylate cyclase (GGDEF)-like protein